VKLKIGYDVETKESVEIELGDERGSVPGHMVLVGQTGCGKTTSLEAFVAQLVGRKRVIIFRTDPNEVGFGDAIPIVPYFGLPADGITAQFLRSILEAHTGEAAGRFMPDLVDICYPDKPQSLMEVVSELMHAREAATIDGKTGLAKKYKVIEAYLSEIVSAIGNITPFYAPLGSDVYLCDLSQYPKAVQNLVIASYLEMVMERLTDTVVVIPEAWELVPNGRSTPVKRAIEALAKKGRKRGNWIWLDSQRLIGMDTNIRTQFRIWLCGLQTDNRDKDYIRSLLPAVRIPPSALSMLVTWEFYLYDSTHNPPALNLVLVETAFNNAQVKVRNLAPLRAGHGGLPPTVDDRTVAELIGQGKFVAEVAKHLGVSRGVIEESLKRSHIPLPGYPGTAHLDDSVLKEQYEQGQSLNQLASRFGANMVTISRRLKGIGVKMRPRGNDGGTYRKRGPNPARVQRDQVIVGLARETAVKDIAAQLGVTTVTVYDALKRLGLKPCRQVNSVATKAPERFEEGRRL